MTRIRGLIRSLVPFAAVVVAFLFLLPLLDMAPLLLQRLLVLLFWGALFSGAAVAIQRRYGTRSLWISWGVAVIVLTAASAVIFHRSFPGVDSGSTTLATMALFIAIPTGTVALVSTRLGRRNPIPTVRRHILLAFLGFIGSLPFALVMGSLPDIARMF